ncbi:hypothetical protein [Falsirhodobacter sp. 20TX0035]|uniref:hypothetical protein n=1 Tax=Falsirhodobacter sp. 20TX0035 TaxID=3022019 RepID=UPI00232C8A2C|nr:hypothetical protein [Falsirhodobacter sp. 20TX0035]MDB6452914.1 hypothetical protein [Falsirhodobacter sp. 20TX0035]
MRLFAPLRALGLILLAMTAVAFATGTIARAAPTVTELRLEAYQLAGGALADLCNDHAPDHAHAASCSLCHLAAGSTLPDTDLPLTLIERTYVTLHLLPQLRRAATRVRDPATPPRGPPAFG